MIALPPRSQPLLRQYVKRPYLTLARKSPALRKWCEHHHYLTPNFSIAEMADTQTGTLPAGSIRESARRHCFNLERLKHRLGGISISIDGPYRTKKHNTEVHGAKDSQHMHGCATDHFRTTVDGWVRASPKVNSLLEVIVICKGIFTAVGNETSGTLHLDSRPGKPGSVYFVNWIGV